MGGRGCIVGVGRTAALPQRVGVAAHVEVLHAHALIELARPAPHAGQEFGIRTFGRKRIMLVPAPPLAAIAGGWGGRRCGLARWGKVRLRISILSPTWFFFMERTFGLPCMQGSFFNGPAKFIFEEARPAETLWRLALC